MQEIKNCIVVLHGPSISYYVHGFNDLANFIEITRHKSMAAKYTREEADKLKSRYEAMKITSVEIEVL